MIFFKIIFKKVVGPIRAEISKSKTGRARAGLQNYGPGTGRALKNRPIYKSVYNTTYM